MNLASQIESSLPASRLKLLRLIADEASARGLALYAVGGLPRDLLINRPARDFDLVLEADTIPFARSLARTHGGRVTVHPKFHTATWHIPPHLTRDTDTPDTIDIISARSETYAHPAALPTVTLGSLADDLRRRDFTINALAIRLDGKYFGELRDDLNVQGDLKNKLIRVLHDKSFIDDPTRIFRAARYAARLNFTIDLHSQSLISHSLVTLLSAARVRHELDAILTEDTAAESLTLLAQLNVLQSIHPALTWDESTHTRFNINTFDDAHGRPLSAKHARWLLWFMPFSADEIASLNKRLHFPAALTKDLLAASTLFAELSSLAGLRPSQIAFRLDTLTVSAIRVVSWTTQNPALETYLAKWRHVKPHTTGDDLKKRGIPAGPRYTEILFRLRAAWLDGEVEDVVNEGILLSGLIAGD